MLRVLHNTKIDFIRLTRVTSIGILVFLLPALAWIAMSGFRLGVEFTGGTLTELRFKQAPDVAHVRAAVASGGVHGAEIQTFGSPNELVIRAQEAEHVKAQAAGASNVSNAINAALIQRFGQGSFTIVRTEDIGPRVASELWRDALIALLISFGVSLLYLAWRFDWRLGLAAVIANTYDVLATFAFIRYANIEITLFVVGAILTVIGYSLSDTVVVFDRVRELLRTHDRKPLSETLNRAINETLPRTVMTGTTVLACLLSLIILGGDVLRPFALVLTFGIIGGTFSSIYVAGPLLLLIERRWPRVVQRRASEPERPARTPGTPVGTRARSGAATR